MAGIGFELRKLIETRTLRGILGAAFSGTLVVAGPWLISAASMAATQSLPFFSTPGSTEAFTGAMFWVFALSICATAGPLYIFVRLTADLAYEGKKGEAASLLLKVTGAMGLASLPIGILAGLALAGELGTPLFVAAFALLLAAIDSLWAVMMTATVIRKYGRILASYLLGMALMYLLARSLGPRLGPAGALLALACGYAVTALSLLFATVEALGRAPYPEAFGKLAAYARKYRNLAAAGSLYAIATWIDKAVLCAFGGVAPAGSRLYVNPGYDTAFYYSNLALIPGLVFFTIVTETEFHLDLKRFIVSLSHKRQPEIAAAKARLVHGASSSLTKQTAFQATIALGLGLMAPVLVAELGLPERVFVFLLAGGVFQLVLLSSLNILFYLELYRYAALCALAFAAINLSLSLAAGFAGLWSEARGLPYLVACAVAAALAALLAFRGLDRFERIVFFRASGEDYGR